MPKHLSEDAIIDLLINPAPERLSKKRVTQMAHFANCERCESRYDEYAKFVRVIGDRDVWEHQATPTQNVDRIAWLERMSAVIRQLSEESAGIEAVLAAALTGSPSGWKAKLAMVGDIYTYSMVVALIARSEKTFATNPAGALQAATLAVEIADRLRVEAYPFDLVINARAQAALELAFILTYRGRLPEALEAIDRSEELFRQMPLSAYPLARAAIVRALIYRSTGRMAEAISLTHTSDATFAQFGDRERVIKARMTEAAMLIQQGRPAEALPICESLEHEPQLLPTRDYAIVLQNIGNCCRELGHLDRAEVYLTRAIAQHGKHNSTAEKVRSEWSRASTRVAAGRVSEGIPMLREVSRAFTSLGLDTDAALASLELAELLLATDQPQEVPAICRVLLDHFARNSMMSRAVTALSFLREAVAIGKATPALVRQVADFIREAPDHPAVAFIPPSL
jgi:tetratricopeptide (TPR) repeat protein